MFDNVQIPDEALVKAVDVADKHVGETYDLTINKIAKEAGDGLADIVHIFFGLPHLLNSPFFKEKAKQFINELLDKKKKIPVDRLVDPDYHTVSLALENCRHCITSDELRHMFVNLICNSMNSEFENKIHPSFSEYIKQMSTLDAIILKAFVDSSNADPDEHIIVSCSFSALAVEEIRVIHPDGSHEVAHTNIVFVDIPDIKYDVHRFSSSITHLQQLGLVNIDYSRYVSENEYHPFKQIEKDIETAFKIESDKIEIKKGIAMLTPIGQDFLAVCVDSQ